MNNLVIFTTAFIVGFSGAATPGPLLTFTISETFRKGFIAGPLIIFGHGILELLIIALILFGLGSVMQTPVFVTTIKVVGGIALLWIGLTVLNNIKNAKLDFDVEGTETRNTVIGGVIVSLSNPYWTMWWATIGLGYLTISMERGILGVTAFYTGHILSDLTWYSFISYVISRGKNVIDIRAYRIMLALCGGFLIILGGQFVFSSFQYVLQGNEGLQALMSID